ncbi:MAG: class I SAM-dependent methyltransferase [Promethearchaeota archaeon]
MDQKNQHYFTNLPDVKLKIYTISESLRRHLYIFKTISGVFSFKKIDLGTNILIENMFIPKEPSVLLDLGCGYGPIGIVLAYESPNSEVFLIDINKHAIWCTKENLKINLPDSKNRVKVLSGNYFEPIKNKELKFDGIYMNPPLRQGRKEFIKLIYKIPDYLMPNGFYQFVMRKTMGASYILKFLKDSYPDKKIEILCKRSGYWVFNCFQE